MGFQLRELREYEAPVRTFKTSCALKQVGIHEKRLPQFIPGNIFNAMNEVNAVFEKIGIRADVFQSSIMAHYYVSANRHQHTPRRVLRKRDLSCLSAGGYIEEPDVSIDVRHRLSMSAISDRYMVDTFENENAQVAQDRFFMNPEDFAALPAVSFQYHDLGERRSEREARLIATVFYEAGTITLQPDMLEPLAEAFAFFKDLRPQHAANHEYCIGIGGHDPGIPDGNRIVGKSRTTLIRRMLADREKATINTCTVPWSPYDE